VPANPPWDFDDWELEDELQSVDRLMDRLTNQGVIDRRLRFDAAESRPLTSRGPAEAPAPTTASAPLASPKPPRRKKSAFSSFMAWSVLSLSLMTFACGAVLLGWSAFTHRPELWTVGLPLALLGQAGLVVGLVLQFDHLWRTNKENSSTLEEIDDQLDDLRRSAALMHTAHNTPSQSFYTHLAHGAEAELLLADLKGQMDLLAQRLAQSKR